LQTGNQPQANFFCRKNIILNTRFRKKLKRYLERRISKNSGYEFI